MALDFQLVNVEFTEGLDTSTNRKLKLPGKWTEADNVAFTEKNVTGTDEPSEGSVRIRDSVTSVDPTLDGNGLATNGEQLLVITGPSVKSVTRSDRGAAVAGAVGYVSLTKESVLRSQGMQDSHDCAFQTSTKGYGFAGYIWRDKSGTATVQSINVTVVDEATKAAVISDLALRTNVNVRNPRIVGTDGGFFCFYIQGTSIYCTVIDTSGSTPVVGTEVAIFTSASLAGVGAGFDAIPGFLADTALLAYGFSDGTTSIIVAEVGRAGTVPVITASTNAVTEANLPIATLSGIAMAINSSNSHVGVFLSSTGGGAFAGTSGVALNTLLVVTTAVTLLDATVNPTVGATHITAVIDDSKTAGWSIFVDQVSNYGAARLNLLRRMHATIAMVPADVATLINSNSFKVNATEASGPQGPWIAGKAFAVVPPAGVASTQVLLPVAILENYGVTGANTRTLNQQCTFYIIDGTTGTVMSRALVGGYGIATINFNSPPVTTPCSTPAVDSDVFALLVPERTRLVLSNGLNVSPTGISRVTLTPENHRAPARQQLGPSTYVSGGSLAAFDGLEMREHGFHLAPEGISCVLSAAGGTVTNGVHQVVAVYEWIDNAGARHQSAPCLAVSVTSGGATDSITVRIPTLQLTARTDVNIAVYMTAAAGLTFYRCTTSAGVFAPLVNDKTVTNLVWSINQADADLTAQEILYTQPNQAGTTLPNTPPPPSSAVVVHQGRLFTDATDNPFTYAFSQAMVPGVGLQWSDQLGGMIDVSSGGIVGLSELDEKVIFFGRRKLFATYGTGPNAAGGFDNYSDPTPIESDVGCSDRRSILRMPFGIIFKSEKGWYVLSRSLEVKYIGEGVEKYNALEVTSAVLLEDRQECRFTVVAVDDPLASRVLVFAYKSGQWSTFSFGGSGGYPINDAIWWPARAAWAAYGYMSLSTTDGLNADTSAGQLDSIGAQVPAVVVKRLRTSFLKVSSLTGFQRVRWLYLSMTQLAGAAAAPTGVLAVSVAFDDDTTGTAAGSYSFSINLSALAGTTNTTDSLDFRHKLLRQKCKSVSFLFIETPSLVGANPLSGLQVMGLEIGQKRGVNKLPAGQNVS